MKFDVEKIIGVIVFVGIVIYLLLGSDFMDTLKSGVDDVNKMVKEEEHSESYIGLQVAFLNVGQADSVLVQFGNHNMLVDAGNNEDGAKLVTYFKDAGISHFDYVVGTHAHEDHIGGMDDIINNFEIDTFYMPDSITTTKTFEDVLDALEKASLNFDTPNVDDEFSLGDASVNVLYVGKSSNDLNDTSIVLKVTFGENSILLMGDAPTSVENKILNKAIDADVLKAGHHGSSYSTSDIFLNKVNPKYAVISSGLNNSYGHPNEETIDKLEVNDIKIYQTDKDGTIIFKTNGSTISFETKKTNTNG